MSDSKVYTLKEEITIQMVAENVRRFLSEQKKLTTESLETNNGYLVQAKAAESWKKFAGMESAIQVQLASVGENALSVNIGSSKWVDKAGAAVAGALVFWPLLATSAIGAWGQKKMPEEILNFIDHYLVSGTYPSVFALEQSSSTSPANGVVCPSCHSMNPESSKFCQKCGAKMGLECPNCHAFVGAGIQFCPECGKSVIPQKEVLECPKCHIVVSENQKFCPECGTPIEHKKPELFKCGSCGAELRSNQKFCPECGTPAPLDVPEPSTVECTNCHAELSKELKFCPECGTPVTMLNTDTQIQTEKEN